jgi:hypothetical protein
MGINILMRSPCTLFNASVYLVYPVYLYISSDIEYYTQTFQRQVIRMNISIEPCTLTFTFDKNTKVKSILPNGDNEFTIVFETQNECSPTQEMAETIHEPVQSNVIPKTKLLDESCCPTVDDIVKYIRSHDYVCDNTEIHLHFLGVILSPRGEDSFYYHKTSDAIRKSKEKIKEEEHGTWIKTGTNKKTRFEISKFRKDENMNNDKTANNIDTTDIESVEYVGNAEEIEE